MVPQWLKIWFVFPGVQIQSSSLTPLVVDPLGNIETLVVECLDLTCEQGTDQVKLPLGKVVCKSESLHPTMVTSAPSMSDAAMMPGLTSTGTGYQVGELKSVWKKIRNLAAHHHHQ
jgi:hypothetical protein